MRTSRGRGWTLARLVVALFLSAPLLWALWASLQPIDRIFATHASPTPWTTPLGSQTPSLQWHNYAVVFERLPFLRFLLNSCVITIMATLGTVLTSSLAGFAFARLNWRGKNVCFVMLLATMMLPSQLLLIPQFLIFEKLGWVNTYKPLIVPSWLGGSAFFIFLFRQFFLSVPQSLQDAARLDGATNWHVYWNIMLPISRPVIGVVAAINAIYHWQDFLDPLVYLSDYHTYPVSLGLRMFQSMEGSWANLIMAASLIALLPPLVVILLTQRFIMRNISPGR